MKLERVLIIIDKMRVKKVPMPKVNSNNPVIKAYVKAVQAGGKIYHLMPIEGRWIVKRLSSKSSRKIFDDKEEAQTYAIKMARKDKTELITYGENGRIKDRISYEN